MRLASVVVFGLVVFAALAVHAQEEEAAEASGGPPVIGDCTPPEVPVTPDRDTALASEIRAAKVAVDAFVAAGEEYAACLDDHEDALGDEIEEEQETEMIDAHNAMVDQMTAVAADFNAVLKAYKARRAAASE